jgi:biopolymer transport protein ExbD
MGASPGTGSRNGKDHDVELNIIPFIDLMSCLTAFLLVTAVWIGIAQLDVHAAGKARDQPPDRDPDPKLSVLIESDQIWIGVSRVDEFERIPKTAAGYDWARFEDRLRAQKGSALFIDKLGIEVAAESTQSRPVSYQSLIAAMDIAIKVGFTDVGVADPEALTARPHL